jgi:competence protein ComEA
MAAVPRNRPKVVEHYVDINSASRKELMTLPGIGAVEADKIIANRPYLTKTQLVTKGVLPTGPYLSLRYQVVAMQKLPPGAKKASTATAAKTVAPQASTPKAP